ncbi:MAG: hypothetical protein V4843_02840 [Pseudomonadota bacterium]
MLATPFPPIDWNAINAIAASLAALFTFGATGAALYIARKTDLRQVADARKRAGLVAALSIADLEDLQYYCGVIHVGLGLNSARMRTIDTAPILLPGSWDAIIGKFPLETLLQLEPLANSAGYRTAQAVGNARNCAEEIREVSRYWIDLSPEIRAQHLEKWKITMSEAAKTFRAVSGDFKAAAHATAKPLTDEERGYVD